MTGNLELFGHPILKGKRDSSLTEQVYQILRGQIEAGRWKVGDRLPAIKDMAEEAGLSAWSFQSAYQRLGADGFISLVKGAGSTLVSSKPQSALPRGTIGVVTPWATPPGEYRLGFIQRARAERNYNTEAIFVDPADESQWNPDRWERVARVDGMFGDVEGPPVKGVISLIPFPHNGGEALELGSGHLPFVYWGSVSSDCLPCVCGDTHNAFCRITRQITQLGHRRIITVSALNEPDREVENRFLGHAKAMEEAGLKADREAHDLSLTLPPGDLRAIREFLTRYAEATAIVVLGGPTQDIIAMSELMGRQIPEDLSIAGMGPRLIRPHDETHLLTRVLFDPNELAAACFDLLEQQMVSGRCAASRLLMSPKIVGGHSLAPPGKVTADQRQDSEAALQA
jgi:hypothetical protein